MEIDFKHALSDQDAKARIDLLGQYLANKHGIKVSWLEPTRARFSGRYLVVKIEGELSMKPNRVLFKGEDPGFLWRNRAKDYIENKLEAYLDPSTPTEKLATS